MADAPFVRVRGGGDGGEAAFLLLDRLAEALERLPVKLPFADPVADARYLCGRALQRARGRGPRGDLVVP